MVLFRDDEIYGCETCGIKHNRAQLKCDSCEKKERLEGVECPNCKSSNIEEDYSYPDTGPIVFGSNTMNIIPNVKNRYCKDCGIMFHKVSPTHKQESDTKEEKK